ncbi:hypothetical protein KKJ22_21910, partial [Xenorhabdus bovienii]|uniref:hypothetical protein n=1 Tax=Xenorhabdus bovienii TaxID=40576 RepID=UPI0023B2C537
PHAGKALHCTEGNPPFDQGELNKSIVAHAMPYVENSQSKTFYFDIQNTDRSIGAARSGEIATRYGDQGRAADPIKLNFTGTAG